MHVEETKPLALLCREYFPDTFFFFLFFFPATFPTTFPAEFKFTAVITTYEIAKGGGRHQIKTCCPSSVLLHFN